MKSNNILRITILPAILLVVASFTITQKPNDKGKDKTQEQSGGKGNDRQDKGNDDNGSERKKSEGENQSAGNNEQSGKGKDQQDRKNDQQGKGSDHKEKGNDHKGKGDDDYGKDKSAENAKYKHDDDGKKGRGDGNYEKMNGKRDADIDWNVNNRSDRKLPKDHKKVTVCHKPDGNGANGVNISISENALKAHLNHGDQAGNCNIDYSDRWSTNYVKSRENVYNSYEQSWETMSYSEALLKLAAEKLLGIKTNLSQTRSTLSTQEIQRREALIFELENNRNSLDTQLGVTRQQLNSDVNIIIKL